MPPRGTINPQSTKPKLVIVILQFHHNHTRLLLHRRRPTSTNADGTEPPALPITPTSSISTTKQEFFGREEVGINYIQICRAQEERRRQCSRPPPSASSWPSRHPPFLHQPEYKINNIAIPVAYHHHPLWQHQSPKIAHELPWKPKKLPKRPTMSD